MELSPEILALVAEDKTIKTMASDLISDITYTYPFNCAAIDIPWGGGIPSGKLIEIYGWESHGKSTLALQATKAFTDFWELKKEPCIVQWIETESTLDKLRAKWFNCRIDKFLVDECETVEDANELIAKRIIQCKAKGIHLLIVWDTIAAAATKAELEGGMYGGGMTQKPRVIRHFFRKITKELAKTDTTLIIVNQVYQGMEGDETTPGGGGIHFHASSRVKVTQTEQRKEMTSKGQELVKAYTAELFHMKSKLTLPKQRAYAIFDCESGLDIFESNLRFLQNHSVVKLAGSWKYIPFPKEIGVPEPTMGDISYQNGAQLATHLKNNPLIVEWIDYLIYAKFATFSPLIKIRILTKLWQLELKFFGKKKTTLNPREFEAAICIYKDLKAEDKDPEEEIPVEEVKEEVKAEVKPEVKVEAKK